MTRATETTTTQTAATDGLLDAMVAQVEAENAEPVELPEPAVITPFPTIL
ncbi:hypothetical protein MKK84_03440 [Methylobacterium sp. E-065]|nr:hypothetical protein [Methylobacterium sp. E-065]MCJ2016485.1 hypothetical protein [Methylobacterium sp. E-065]